VEAANSETAVQGASEAESAPQEIADPFPAEELRASTVAANEAKNARLKPERDALEVSSSVAVSREGQPDAIELGRDSAVPLESSDFVEESAQRARALPKAPAPPRRPKAESEWIDELPISVGTPTLAALVQRANSESERPATNSAPADVLLDPSFELPASDWDPSMMPLLRKPDTDAPVVSPSIAPTRRSRTSSVVVLLAVASGAFAAGLAVKRPAPPPAAHVSMARAEAAPNIQAARPVVTPPEFATEPLAPEQSPAALPLADLATPDAEPAGARAPTPAAHANNAQARKAAATNEPVAAFANTGDRAQATLPTTGNAASKPANPALEASLTEAESPDFDAAAAETAISAAASRAVSCKRPGDPSGVAVVTITFSPSGRATTANVSGLPFAGTATGGCIAATLRAARVPVFSGDFVTVKKTIKLD
jgi:hypothetical protein